MFTKLTGHESHSLTELCHIQTTTSEADIYCVSRYEMTLFLTESPDESSTWCKFSPTDNTHTHTRTHARTFAHARTHTYRG